MSVNSVTGLLASWRTGDSGAEAALLDAVYGDLHRKAAVLLRGERHGHTLQPTALVHEAYLRLVDQKHVDWQDRAHFYAIAARSMRRVLLDHARKRQTEKRGPGSKALSLDDAGELARERPEDLLRLDDALAELVTSLALLWVDATGEPMSYPGFDDATGRYGVAFVAFLNFFTAATDCAFVDDAPTDEAIRHKLREAIERGDISQKSARPRLSQAPPEAPTLVSIETNQVVTSHDDEARGDLGRGDQSGGA